MSYQGLMKVSDLMGLGLSVAYDTSLDYNKVNTTMLIEKSAYHIGGTMLQSVLNDFLPKFLKQEGDILYQRSNQESLTTSIIAGVYTYYGKNKSFKESIKIAAIEGASSFIGHEVRKALGKNPNFKLTDDVLL
jgi:hypothetical protein